MQANQSLIYEKPQENEDARAWKDYHQSGAH